jgi:integrase
MRAMISLGINGGFGPTDCGQLVWTTIDFENGWIIYPRPKTGVSREVPLWNGTVESLRSQKHDDELVFLTPFGNAWSGNSLAHALGLSSLVAW